jgi:hypothetical protein
MDWTPTSERPPQQAAPLHIHDDGSWLKPQQFFAPEHPTGLESILANTRLLDDVREPSGRRVFKWNWGVVYAVSTAPVLMGLAYSVWARK